MISLKEEKMSLKNRTIWNLKIVKNAHSGRERCAKRN